jgi:hypothetical protein
MAMSILLLIILFSILSLTMVKFKENNSNNEDTNDLAGANDNIVNNNVTPAAGGGNATDDPDNPATSSTTSDAGAFVLAETSLDMHQWGEDPVVTAKLQFNGQDRFSEREGTYFDLVQPDQRIAAPHCRTPRQCGSLVEVEIGGQRIDRQYGDWMHIWNQLTLSRGTPQVGLTAQLHCQAGDSRQICRGRPHPETYYDALTYTQADNGTNPDNNTVSYQQYNIQADLQTGNGYNTYDEGVMQPPTVPTYAVGSTTYNPNINSTYTPQLTPPPPPVATEDDDIDPPTTSSFLTDSFGCDGPLYSQ